MMINYDAIFIGWGKAAKTLAKKMALAGKKVAMIEQAREMAGGTCINIACIPTKVLVTDMERNIPFTQAMERRAAVVEKLNQSNYQKLVEDEQVTLYFAQASFLDNKTIQVQGGDDQLEITADKIFINTGAISVVPPIEGLAETEYVYDSTSIQTLEELPKSIGIIGGGNIGIEFASIFAGFQANVILIESGEGLLPRHEPEIRETCFNETNNSFHYASCTCHR